MTRGKVYESRKSYIENGIGVIMAVKQDFDSIRYAKSGITDAEYVRIADILGRSVCLDVTAMSLEDILKDVCRIMLVGDEKIAPPRSVITDIKTLRDIAPLFKGAA